MTSKLLHFEILPASQREVWNRLKEGASRLRKLGFYLAGGTALTLQLGHRRSVDFDFFSQKKGVAADVRRWLEPLDKFVLREADADTVHAELRGVKISFIGAYKYPLVNPLLESDGIRIANVTDIGLMKFLAITHRATLRDYVDLAALIQSRVSLGDLLKKSRRKYGSAFNPMIPLKALVSFKDLDTEMPPLMDRRLARSWQKILQDAVRRVIK